MKKYFQVIMVFILFLCLIPMISLLAKRDGTKIGSTDINKSLQPLETVKILDADKGEIEEIDIDTYLCGAVAAQMPFDFEPEALKAQVILAHTYILSRRMSEQSDPTPELMGADISLDESIYQPYFTYDDIKALYGDDADRAVKKITAAVKQAGRIIAVYENKPIISAFHGISSGFTESAENAWGIDIPYLKSVESEADPSSPDYSKKYTMTAGELKAALTSAYPDLTFESEEEYWLDISETSRGGTVLGVGVGDNKTLLSGYDLMKLLDLRSPNFKVTYDNGLFTFTVRGCGHLVGMSQYGANELAKSGKSCEEILKFYFKGIDVAKLGEKE